MSYNTNLKTIPLVRLEANRKALFETLKEKVIQFKASVNTLFIGHELKNKVLGIIKNFTLVWL